MFLFWGYAWPVRVMTIAVGAYRFEKLNAQQYMITVQKTGYQPNRKTVTAISVKEMEINIPRTKIKNEDNN